MAMRLVGMLLLLPVLAFSHFFDASSPVTTYAGLGIALFIWTWLLVMLFRILFRGVLPVWRLADTFVKASRARKVAAALVATVLLACALFPVRSVTVPAWKIQFVDTAGNPFANIPVRQYWADSGLESEMTSHEAEATTDAQGYVEFPERPLMTVFVANWSARTLHSSTARHSYIVQLCDLMDHGGKGAMYFGEELPDRVTLRYFSRESIRHSTSMPANPTCAASESQAKAADASKGIGDAPEPQDCNPEQAAKAPPATSARCGRAQAHG